MRRGRSGAQLRRRRPHRQATFSNAALKTHEDERAYGSDEAHATRSSRATFAAYEGRIESFAGETEIAPGLTAVPLPGHTPGHSGLRITSGDEALLIWTDIVRLAPVQLAMPAIGANFEVDPNMARATRIAFLEQVAADRTLIAGSHIGFPGIGWIEPDGKGYRFVPIPYTHDSQHGAYMFSHGANGLRRNGAGVLPAADNEGRLRLHCRRGTANRKASATRRT